MRQYITGQEIFESGIMTSQELGYLCYADEVTAWHVSGGAHYMGGSQYEEFKACACHSRTAIPFSFDFIEYERLEIEQDEDIGYFGALSKYEEKLSNMLFEKAEIEKIIACRTCADGNTPAPVAGMAKDEAKSFGDISAVPEHIVQEYKEAAAHESKGRRKRILALLYYAQGWRTERIAEELGWAFGDGKNIVTNISKGRDLSKDKQLTDLSPYLAIHGRKGNTPSE